MKTELDKFYGLIGEINIAMLTTRRPDGHLESRAMANQKRADGADLWFVTEEGTSDGHAAVFLEVNKPKPIVLF